MSVVEVRPDLSLLAAQVAIVYRLSLETADAIVKQAAEHAIGHAVTFPETPARAALLAPYRRPDGSVIISVIE